MLDLATPVFGSPSNPWDRSRRDSERPAVADVLHKTTQPRRVLLIEDNLDSVHSMVFLLRDMGHYVEYAINGYAGIEVARRFRPEVVLLDLGLPGLNGFDVCKELKRLPGLEQTRFIAITGYAQDEYRVRSRAAGCEMHLLKPIPPRVLEELLG
jgi:CheY-like chemotaxis protein